MRNADKTKEQLIEELEALRLRTAELEKLEAEWKRIRQALVEIPTGVMNLDLKGKITYINKTILQGTGYSREELVGKNAFRLGLIAPETLKLLRRRMEEKLAGRPPRPLEIQLKCKDGTWMWLQIRGKILREHGMPVGIQVVGEDITERKQAELEYKTILQTSVDSFWLTDMQGRFLDVNDAYCQLVGYSRDELLKISIPDVEAIEKPEETAARIAKIRKVGRDRFETRHRRKDGRIVDVEVSVNYIEVAGGRMFVFVRDITERKQAREALERQKAYFQQLFDNSPEGIALLDDTDRVVQVNKGFETLFGYQTEEIKGWFINDIVVPEDRIEEASAMSQAALNGKVVREETVRKRKNGSLVDVSTVGYPIQFGNKTVGVYAIYSDITERKQAEEELRKNEEKLRLISENSRDIICLHDSDHRYVYVSPACKDVLGYELEELVGTNPWELVHPQDLEGLQKLGQDKAEKGEPVLLSYRIRKKSGEYIWFESVSRLLTDDAGSILGFVTSSRDITERKRAEEERREMEQKSHVASRLASVGEMASGIAHEINNPLTAVIGFSQLLMDADLPDDVREDISVIHKEAQRAAGVAKNLLTFARKQASVKELTNMNSIIDGVLKLRAYEQRVSNIQVNTRFAPQLPEVMADYSQLQQVFINIILNAEAAMLEAHHRGTLAITTQKVNNSVRASFTDSGPGITEENLNRIFDPFFTTKEVGKGTGLGLSVCHGIIAEHGGRIYARSKLGNGATFVVELPVNAH